MVKDICALPNEILLSIFELFGVSMVRDRRLEHQSTETLAKLCLTSRQFRDLATPILYRAFLKPENVEFGCACCDMGIQVSPNRKLQLFLRTLLEHPALRPLVRLIDVQKWGMECSCIYNLPPECLQYTSPDKEIAALYADIAQRLSFGKYTELWRECLADSYEGAEVALLFALVPNLQMAMVDVPDMSLNDDTDLFLGVFDEVVKKDQAISNCGEFTQGFRSLEYLAIWTDNNQPLDDLAAFVSLPRIRSLKLIISSKAVDCMIKGETLAMEGGPRL